MKTHSSSINLLATIATAWSKPSFRSVNVSLIFAVSLTVLTSIFPRSACGNSVEAILNATSNPINQGWSVIENTGGPFGITFNEGAIRINTWNAPSQPDDPGASPRLLFYKPLTIPSNSAFSVEFDLRVHQATYNRYDAGVAFVGDYYSPLGNRSTMLVFGEDKILWGDFSASFAMNTTSDFHVYRFDVNGSEAQFYVDGQLALRRSDFVGHNAIAFGDQSNDGAQNNDRTGPYVGTPINGDYSIRYITVGVIPEPHTISLLGFMGLGLLASRRRCKRFE